MGIGVSVASHISVPPLVHQVLHDLHRLLSVSSAGGKKVELELASQIVHLIEFLQIVGIVEIALRVRDHRLQTRRVDTEYGIPDVAAREIVGHFDENLSLCELQHIHRILSFEARDDHVLCPDCDLHGLLYLFWNLSVEVEIIVDCAQFIASEYVRVDVGRQSYSLYSLLSHHPEDADRFFGVLRPVVDSGKQMAMAVECERQIRHRYLFSSEEYHRVSSIVLLAMSFGFWRIISLYQSSWRHLCKNRNFRIYIPTKSGTN